MFTNLYVYIIQCCYHSNFQINIYIYEQNNYDFKLIYDFKTNETNIYIKNQRYVSRVSLKVKVVDKSCSNCTTSSFSRFESFDAF
jgi:hypothetical protein